MTWGTHCSQCGREDCSWTCGDACEGRLRTYEAEIVQLRWTMMINDPFEQYVRAFTRRIVPLKPGEVAPYTLMVPPVGCRWETDDELRERILADKEDQ